MGRLKNIWDIIMQIEIKLAGFWKYFMKRKFNMKVISFICAVVLIIISLSAFFYDLPEYKEKISADHQDGNTEIKAKLDELLANNCRLLNEFHEKRL